MRKEENRGFSLVELLVAVVILGVIAVPFFHAFVSVFNTNGKSRKVAQATTAAQNVMEELRAVSAASIVAAGYSPESSSTYTKNVSVDGHDYRAVVSLDKTSAINDTTQYNDSMLTSLYAADEDHDCLIAETSSNPVGVLAHVTDYVPMTTVEAANLHRRITLEIKKDPSSGDTMVEKTVYYVYDDGAAEHELTSGTVPPELVKTVPAGKELSSVQLFMEPMYIQAAQVLALDAESVAHETPEVPAIRYNYNVAQMISSAQDIITVINHDTGRTEPLRVYIVKQEITGDADFDTLYSAQVHLIEPSAAMGSTSPETKLCTNLMPEDGGADNYVHSFYYGNSLPGTQITMNMADNTYSGLDTLSAKRQQPYVYKVKVEIREKGDDSLVAQLEGVKQE